jgi:hypothetical protein
MCFVTELQKKLRHLYIPYIRLSEESFVVPFQPISYPAYWHVSMVNGTVVCNTLTGLNSPMILRSVSPEAAMSQLAAHLLKEGWTLTYQEVGSLILTATKRITHVMRGAEPFNLETPTTLTLELVVKKAA